MVRPATVDRMVAKATEAMTASMIEANSEPPMLEPTASASIGAAVLPAGFCSEIVSCPTRAAAPKPRTRVIR